MPPTPIPGARATAFRPQLPGRKLDARQSGGSLGELAQEAGHAGRDRQGDAALIAPCSS